MNRLKELRNEYNLTVRALAQLININSTSISYYEQESRDFNTHGLKIFSDFFCVSIDYLLCHKNEGIFVYYEQGEKVYCLDDTSFKKYKNEDLIYYKDYKRYLDINKILGIKKETNVSELLELINYQQIIDKSFMNIESTKINVPLDRLEVVDMIISLDEYKFKAIKNIIGLL